LGDYSLTRVREVLDEFPVVSPALVQHPDVANMVSKVLINSLRPAASVSEDLASSTQDDWEEIGKSLSSILATKTRPDAAISDFIAKYPALEEFDALYDWFRPMLETVAKRTLKHGFKANAKLYFGAGLGTFEMVTDINMIIVLLGAISFLCRLVIKNVTD
jgi:hypothetical protein